jgi:hypothetical protein
MAFGVKENTRQAAIQAIYSSAHQLAADWAITGIKVYTRTLDNESGFAKGMSIDVRAVQIQGIEHAGWVLQTFTVDGGKATCLFRRVHE